MQSYLTNSIQFFKLGNTLSSPKIVKCGVPQGSCLGPLLFLLYINDFVNISEHLSSILFADDTTKYASEFNVNTLIRHVTQDLEKVKEWCNSNQLSLNLSKTCTMALSLIDNQTPKIKIDNFEIMAVNSTSFLGLKIDNKLCFSDHVANICLKLAKTLGIFHKLRYYVPKSVLLSLYYSLVYPH